MRLGISRAVLAVCALCLSQLVRADEILVAVAANFTDASRELAALFTDTTGHRARLSYGSTGKLYAQIEHGAPFDVFLAADRQRPALAEQNGLAVTGSRFTYARGKLVLWSPHPDAFEDGEIYLNQAPTTPLAIANPRTAPYGLAARQTLESLTLWTTWQPRLVRGDSIAQAFQFVATGNAGAGFVALSQVSAWPDPVGSVWPVPETLYQPIEQQAVLLTRAQHNPVARAWMQFLRGEPAQAVIRRYGYATDSPNDADG